MRCAVTESVLGTLCFCAFVLFQKVLGNFEWKRLAQFVTIDGSLTSMLHFDL